MRFLDEDAFAFGGADAFVRAFLRGTSGSSSLGIWVSGSGEGSGSGSGEGALRFATRLSFGAGSCLEGVSSGGAQESAYSDSPGAADVLALVPFVAALGLGLGFAGAAGMFAYSKNAGVEGTCLMLRAWKRHHLGLRRARVWLGREWLSGEDLSHIMSTYGVALVIFGVLAV